MTLVPLSKLTSSLWHITVYPTSSLFYSLETYDKLMARMFQLSTLFPQLSHNHPLKPLIVPSRLGLLGDSRDLSFFSHGTYAPVCTPPANLGFSGNHHTNLPSFFANHPVHSHTYSAVEEKLKLQLQ